MNRVILVILVSSQAYAYAQTLRADSLRVEVGNPFMLYLEVPGAKPERPNLEAWHHVLPPDQVLSISEWEPTDQGWRSQIKCIFLDSMTVVLPPLTVRESSTDSLLVEVYPTPITDTLLAPIHQIVATPAPAKRPNFGTIAPWASIFLCLLGLGYYLWRYQKHRHGLKQSVPSIHADQWQIRFQALGSKIPLEPQKAYYEELSLLLRMWLEQQHQVKALECTSAEIIKQLSHHPVLRAKVDQIGQVLDTSDQVKFAKGTPDLNLQMHYYRIVRNLTETTTTNPSAT